jgi:D-glycero-D-manno-heptose 1,7-bisphosphate phosphatase
MTPLRRAVFLDRDGVLNRAIVRNGKPYPPAALAELEILPGVAESLKRLRRAGFLLLVVTNQPDVGRGKQRREVVEAINDTLRAKLPLDEVFTCYDDEGPRKKPNPGMLLEAAERYGVELKGSYMIGDRWKDVEAGRRAGCRTVFIDYGYAESFPTGVVPDVRASDLSATTDWILAAIRPGTERRNP